jgi:hypothetical protein
VVQPEGPVNRDDYFRMWNRLISQHCLLVV